MVLSVVALISKTTINGKSYSTVLWSSGEDRTTTSSYTSSPNNIDTISNLILLQGSNHSFDVVMSTGGIDSTDVLHIQDMQFMNNSIHPPFYHRHLQFWTKIPSQIASANKGHFLLELPSIPEQVEESERPNEEYSRILRIHNSTNGSLLLSLTWQTVTHSMITPDSIMWLEDNTCGFSSSHELLDAAVEDYVNSHTRRNSLLPPVAINDYDASIELQTSEVIENIDLLSQIGYWLYSTPLGDFIRGSKIETSGRPLKLQKLTNSTISLIGRHDLPESGPYISPSSPPPLLPAILPVLSGNVILHLCQYHLISTDALPDNDFLVAWLISIGWTLVSDGFGSGASNTDGDVRMDLLFQFDCGDSDTSNIRCTIRGRTLFVEITLQSRNDSPLHDRRGPWLKNCYIDFIYHCIYKSVGASIDLLMYWSSKCHVEYSHLPSKNSLIRPFRPSMEYDPSADFGRVFEVLTWSPFIMDWVLSSIRIVHISDVYNGDNDNGDHIDNGGDINNANNTSNNTSNKKTKNKKSNSNTNTSNNVSYLQFLQNDTHMILYSLRLTQCKMSVIKDKTMRFILQGPANIMVCFFPCEGGRKVAWDLMHLMSFYIANDKSILSANNDPVMKKWESYFWFSYRKGFTAKLGDTILSSDAGFGCMVRACQGILGEALKRCLLPSTFELEDRYDLKEYRDILEMFADDGHSRFGIHSIFRRGVQFGVPIGQCFGPSVISRILKEIIIENLEDLPFSCVLLKDGSCFFHREELYRSLVVGKALLILLPIQLGIDFLDPEYDSVVRGILKHPNSLGLAGGHGGNQWFSSKSRYKRTMKTLVGSRTGRAYHVLGVEESIDGHGHSDSYSRRHNCADNGNQSSPNINTEDEFNLLYLDPHEIREVPASLDEAIINREYHTKGMGVMPIGQLNPSILFAFLVNNKDEVTVLSNYLVDLSSDIFTK